MPGSIINHLMPSASASANLPSPGDGATICMWTDRKAGTVIYANKREIRVQEDTATRIDEPTLTSPLGCGVIGLVSPSML